MMSIKPRGKVGSGRNVTNRHERTFRKGSLMFIEGEVSREMYIIRTGRVRILRQEGESSIELAVLGPGSVLGELSLLDGQPRGATGQVLEETQVTVIDEELFNKTMSMIPSWMNNIIQVVIRRLRDTMKRTSEDVVKKSVAGCIRIMLLLLRTDAGERDLKQTLPLPLVKSKVYSVIGLGGAETENVLLHLILKEMVFIKTDTTGKEYIVLRDPEGLRLYMNYLRAHQRNTVMPGENLSENAVALLGFIAAAGRKSGRAVQGSVKSVGVAQIEIELERQGKGRHVDLDALDELIDAKLVVRDQKTTQSSHGSHKRTTLMYNEENLKRMRVFHKWLPLFREEVKL